MKKSTITYFDWRIFLFLGFHILSLTLFAQPPSTPATDIVVSNNGTNSIDLTWTSGDGFGGAIVIVSDNTDAELPEFDGSYSGTGDYSTAEVINPDWKSVYNGTVSSTTIIGLDESTEYKIWVVEYNFGVGVEYYTGTAGTGNPTNHIIAGASSGELVSGSSVSSSGTGFDFSREETLGLEDEELYQPDFVFVSNEGVNFGNEGSSSLSVTGVRFQRVATSGGLSSVTTAPDFTGTAPWVTVSYDFSNGTGGLPIAVGEIWAVYTREGNYALMEITAVGTSDFNFDYKYQPDGTTSFDGGVSLSLTINTPNGGEELTVGEPYEITWTDNFTGSDLIEIGFSTDGGDSFTLLNDGVFSTYAGSYSWTVPDNVGNNNRIRILNTTESFSDVSDGVFTISAASTGVVNGSSVSSSGTGFDFSREETLGLEDEELYQPDFVFVSNEGVNFGNEGSSSLSVTGVRFQRVATSGGLSSVTTAPDFTGTAPWVTVSYDFSNGTGGLPIAVGEIWAVYTREGNYALMEITAVGTSDFNFDYKYQPDGTTSFDGGVSLSLTINTPNGGEELTVGEPYEITWTDNFTGSDLIEIGFSTDGGDSFTLLNDGVFSTYAGSYSWTVPDNVGNNNRIRILNTTESFSDVSDGVFTISAASTGVVNGSSVSSSGTGFDFSREETLGLEDEELYQPDFVFVSNEGVNFGNEGSSSLSVTGVRFQRVATSGGLSSVTTAPDFTGTAPWVTVSYDFSNGTGGLPISVGEIWAVYTREGNYALMEITAVGTSDFNFDYKYQPDGTTSFDGGVSLSLTINTPNGGEELTVGEPYEITWTDNFTGSDLIEIGFSTDGGDSFTLLNDGVFSTYAGSYSWTVPDNVGNNNRIRILNTTESFSDVSDGVFTISAASTGVVNGSSVSSSGTGFDFSREETLGLEDEELYQPDFVFVSNEGVNFGNEGSSSLSVTGVRFQRVATSGGLSSVTTAPDFTGTAPWVTVSYDFSNGTGGLPIAVGEIWAVYTREGNYALMEITAVGTSDFNFDYKYQPDGTTSFDGGGSSNTPPTVSVNSALTVDNAGTGIFTSDNLLVDDAETGSAGVFYRITAAPVNGTIQFNGNVLGVNSTFLQVDIADSKITYVHDGSATTSDSFEFELNDGTDQLSGQVFTINISEPTSNLLTTVADGVWSATSTWAGGVVPTTTNDVEILNNVTLDVNTTINDLTISLGGILNMGTSTLRLIVTGNFTKNAGGNFVPGDGTLTMNGADKTYSHSGDITFYTLEFGGAGTTTLDFFSNNILFIDNLISIGESTDLSFNDTPEIVLNGTSTFDNSGSISSENKWSLILDGTAHSISGGNFQNVSWQSTSNLNLSSSFQYSGDLTTPANGSSINLGINELLIGSSFTLSADDAITYEVGLIRVNNQSDISTSGQAMPRILIDAQTANLVSLNSDLLMSTDQSLILQSGDLDINSKVTLSGSSGGIVVTGGTMNIGNATLEFSDGAGISNSGGTISIQGNDDPETGFSPILKGATTTDSWSFTHGEGTLNISNAQISEVGGAGVVMAGGNVFLNSTSFTNGLGTSYLAFGSGYDGKVFTGISFGGGPANNATFFGDPEQQITFDQYSGDLGGPDFDNPGANGNILWTNGTITPPGNALQFDNSDFLNAGTTPISGTGEFSVSAWFNTTKVSGQQVIITSRGPSIFSSIFELDVEATGQVLFTVGTQGGSNTIASNITGLNDGEWHHVVATRAASGTLSLFVDGAFDSDQAQTAISMAGAVPIFIGRNTRDGGANFVGQLDEVALWNSALGSEEIQLNWLSPVSDYPSYTSSALRYYSFDQESGTTVDEITGQGEPATFNGTLEWVPSGALAEPLDISAPTFQTLSTAGITDTNITINVGLNESGTIYYVAVGTGATPPITSEILDPQTYSGAIESSGNLGPITSDIATFSGLFPSTTYDLYFVAEDAAGNFSTVQPLLNVSTTEPVDETAPTFINQSPFARDVLENTAQFTVEVDEEANVYMVVVADGSTAPTVSDMFNETGFEGALAVSTIKQLISANASTILEASGLSSGTAYDAYFLAEDISGNTAASPSLVEITTSSGTPKDITVLNTNDSGAGSLREALATSNNGDRIIFDNAVDWTANPINLLTELTIATAITIDAPDSKVTLDQTGTGRVLTVSSTELASIHNLNITGGSGVSGKGVYVGENASIVISNSHIHSNKGGGAGAGGGLYADVGALVEIYNTTIANNDASNGGGIYNNEGNISLVNVTISENRAEIPVNASNQGGAIYHFGEAGSLILTNCTLAGNHADDFYGGLRVNATTQTMTIQNSVIVGNTTVSQPTSKDVFAGTANIDTENSGNNIVQTSALSAADLGTNSQIDIAATGNLGSLNDGTINLNGIPTRDPIETGILVDEGNNVFIPLDKYDIDSDGNTTEPFPFAAGGNDRVNGVSVDIGAAESAVGAVSIVITSPVGGETYEIGSTQTVSFTTVGLDASQELELRTSSDGGETFGIANDGLISSLAGEFSWLTTEFSAGDYLIKIQTNGGEFYESSTVAVTLVAPEADPVITGEAQVSITENQTSVSTYTADKTVTWTLTGDDADLFSIDTEGNVSFMAAPDFESPADLNTDNVYEILVQGTDANNNNNVGSLAVNINVTDEDENAPVFTSATSVAIDENIASGVIYIAEATDESTLTYSLSGTDEASFTLDETSGELTITNSPDFEAQSSYELTITATDALSNSSDLNLTVSVNDLVEDITAPTVVISTESLSPTNAATISATITFSEEVTGFNVDSLTLTNATASNFSGEGAIYTIDVSPIVDGDFGVSVLANKAEDLAGNNSEASNSLVLVSDRTAPTVIMTSDLGLVTNADVVPITVTFSEAVTGFDESDLTLLFADFVSVSGEGSEYIVAISPQSEGDFTIRVKGGAAVDAVGNNSIASETLRIESDITGPSININSLSTQNDSPEITGTVGEESATVTVEINGLTYEAVNNGFDWVLEANTIESLAIGEYQMTAIATDIAGNENNAIGTLDIFGGPTRATAVSEVSFTGFTANWRARTGVDSYELDVARDAAFLQILPNYNSLSITQNSHPITGLAFNTSYFYRVRAIYSGTGASENSNIISVKTAVDEGIAQDSSALATIYTALGGENWTRNNNWADNTRINEWQGVSFESSRVISIDLSESNLIGSFPTISEGLDAVQTIILQNNQISQMADVTNLLNLLSLDISENNLAYGSLEINTAIENYVAFPQKPVFEATDFLVEIGTSFEFDGAISGSANSYVWTKEPIGGGTSQSVSTTSLLSFEVNDFNVEGDYLLTITSAAAGMSGTTLESGVFTVKVSSLERDITALQVIYNANGGSNWDDVTDWNTMTVDNIANFGPEVVLTTDNSRVSGISLSGLSLIGAIPREINDIAGLTTVDLSNNQLTDLPTMTRLKNLTNLNVSNNRLDFGDLEKNSTISGITYSPQANISEVPNERIAEGSNYSIMIKTGGTKNKYEWRLTNDVVTNQLLSSESSSTFNITAIDYESMGNYVLIVTNDQLPLLTLRTDPIVILATANVTGSIAGENDQPLSRGGIAAFKIGRPNQPYQKVDSVIVSSGTFLLPELVLGNYIFITNSDILNNEGKLLYLPTYYKGTDLWIEADTLFLRTDADIQDYTMAFLPPPPTEGEGNVSGLVEADLGESSGRILERRKVKKAGCSVRRFKARGRDISVQDGTFELLAYVETNDNGEFEFNFLPSGLYRFNIEFPGIPMDPDSYVEFEIGGDGFDANNFKLEAFITENGIEVTRVAALAIYEQYFLDLDVFPVPAKDYINIRYDRLLSDRVEVKLIDLEGKIISTQRLERGWDLQYQLDVSEVADGFYLLQFLDPDKRMIVSYKVFVRH